MSLQRDLTLDAFRGLTMLFMLVVNNPGSWAHVYPPLRHAAWHGWTAADFIFPFFLFTVGASLAIPFGGWPGKPGKPKMPGLSGRPEVPGLPGRPEVPVTPERPEGRASWGPPIIKILRRSLILFGLGILLNAFPFGLLHVPQPPGSVNPSLDLWPAFTHAWTNVRILGVLQRIALCYLLVALFVKFAPLHPVQDSKKRPYQLGLWACAFLVICLISYELIMHHGTGGGYESYDQKSHAAAQVDRFFIASEHLYRAGRLGFDPEGLVSTLGAAMTTVGGFLFYLFYRLASKRAIVLMLCTAAIVVGLLLHSFKIEPVNKLLWTPAYVALTAGWGGWLFALTDSLYKLGSKSQICRVVTAGLHPAVTVGRNAIVVYVLSSVLGQTLIYTGQVLSDQAITTKAKIYMELSQYFDPFQASLFYALLFVVLFSALAMLASRYRLSIKIG